MPTLYATAYLAPSRRKPPDAPSDVAGAFYTAVARATFPYDIGDDPSFFASDYHQSPVTWGVCRPDVRGMISPRDWMVFFSAERDARIADPAATRVWSATRIGAYGGSGPPWHTTARTFWRPYLLMST